MRTLESLLPFLPFLFAIAFAFFVRHVLRLMDDLHEALLESLRENARLHQENNELRRQQGDAGEEWKND